MIGQGVTVDEAMTTPPTARTRTYSHFAAKPVGPHTLRHGVATHLVEAGYGIRTVQKLLGHREVKTTMIYTHLLNRGGRGVQSPADRLLNKSGGGC